MFNVSFQADRGMLQEPDKFLQGWWCRDIVYGGSDLYKIGLNNRLQAHAIFFKSDGSIDYQKWFDVPHAGSIHIQNTYKVNGVEMLTVYEAIFDKNGLVSVEHIYRGIPQGYVEKLTNS